MARTRTLTDLIADVRDRADVENSTHVTDAQITRYINQSGAALHAMMVEHDEDEFTEELTLTAAAGAEYSTIGTGAGGEFLEVKPYKIVGVDVVDSNGVSYPVPRYMHGERANLESAGITSVFQLTRYRWRGTNTLYWAPPFSTNVTVRVTYVPSYVDLSGSDPFDGRDGWEEWIVLDAAIKVAIKEETDDSQMVRERAVVEQRIRQQMIARDRANPKRIKDVWGGGDTW